jgi:hypothetical protein
MATLDITGETVDGFVEGADGGGYYANARSTSSSYDSTSDFIAVGQDYSGGIYYVDRGFVKFNTATIPAGATITGVTMTLTCKTDGSTANFDIQIVKQDWSGQDPLSAANREAAFDGCLAGTADDNIWRNTLGMSTNTAYASGALATAYINVSGYTYYSLRSAEDKNNSAPAGSEWVDLYSASTATAAYKPILNITYTPAASPTRRALLGVGV